MDILQALKADMDHYHRLDPDHPDKSYSYLKRCPDRHIDSASQKLRRQEQVQHINQPKKRGKSRPKRHSGDSGRSAKGEKGYR